VMIICIIVIILTCLLKQMNLTLKIFAAIAGSTKYMEEIKELHQRYVKLKAEKKIDEANAVQQRIKFLVWYVRIIIQDFISHLLIVERRGEVNCISTLFRK